MRTTRQFYLVFEAQSGNSFEKGNQPMNLTGPLTLEALENAKKGLATALYERTGRIFSTDRILITACIPLES